MLTANEITTVKSPVITLMRVAARKSLSDQTVLNAEKLGW